jgi:hypothetical protein
MLKFDKCREELSSVPTEVLEVREDLPMSATCMHLLMFFYVKFHVRPESISLKIINLHRCMDG